MSIGYTTRCLNYVNNAHQGYVLEKYFDVKVESCGIFYDWLFRNFIIKLYRKSTRLFLSDDGNYSTSRNTIFYLGYWQDCKYMPSDLNLHFRDMALSEKNTKILEVIKSTNSVSLHIRRGDYLKPQNISRFGNICTEEYYRKAMEIIKNNIKNPHYFVFSDEIEWCKQNLELSNNTHFVDWNIGDDSILDMYLMSKCKANIIANSSFSYWSAKLSGNKLVVYPAKWFNDVKAPTIFDNTWLGI